MNLVNFFKKRNTKSNFQSLQVMDFSELPSLGVAFDLIRARIVTQLQEVDGLDAKANFARGAATTLVGTGLILQAVLLNSHTHSYCAALIPAFLHLLPSLLKRALPLMPLLGTYVVVVLFTHRAYKICDYELVPEPRELLNYLEKPVIITKVDVLKEMVDDYEQNEKKINKKAHYVSYALLTLNIEGLALVVLLLYQAIC